MNHLRHLESQSIYILRAIIQELLATRKPERAGRAHDHESEDAFEKLRRDGFM